MNEAQLLKVSAIREAINEGRVLTIDDKLVLTIYISEGMDEVDVDHVLTNRAEYDTSICTAWVELVPAKGEHEGEHEFKLLTSTELLNLYNNVAL